MQRFFLVLFLVAQAVTAFAQTENTSIHEVKSGDTKYGISRQYDISIERLEKFNPDIEKELKVGMKLLIPPPAKQEPSDSLSAVIKSDSGFVQHEVKAGQTLYSISRTYGVDVGEIKENNPQLADGLKTGQVLYIPVKEPEEESAGELAENYHLHKVKRQETPWAISQLYEISLDSLYLLNPEAQQGLQIGQVLKLPLNRADGQKPVPRDELATDQPQLPSEGAGIADTSGGYLLYKIKTGDSFYSLKQRFDISQEELVRLNPEVVKGLEVGKYIIIPQKTPKEDVAFFDRLFKQVEDVGSPSEDQIRRRDSMNLGGLYKEPVILEDTLDVDITKNYLVAVMLPFYASLDTIDTVIDREVKVPKRSVYALDFYQGFLMAADSLTREGMNLHLNVIDTENNLNKIRKMIPRLQKSQYDLVVGPLYKRSVEYVADQLEDQDIPVISPLSSTVDLEGHPNLIKCIPGSRANVEHIAHLVNTRFADYKVVFVDFVPADGLGQGNEILQVKARLASRSQNHSIETVSVLEDEMDMEGVEEAIPDSGKSVAIVLSEDRVFMTAVVGGLRSANTEANEITLVASPKVMDISTLDLNYLNALDLTMPDINYVNYGDSATVNFIAKYRERFESEPSRYSYQGYDVGMYFLRKLWKTGPFFMQAIRDPQPMLSTGFDMRRLPEGGFENTFMYITGIRNFNLVKLEDRSEESGVGSKESGVESRE